MRGAAMASRHGIYSRRLLWKMIDSKAPALIQTIVSTVWNASSTSRTTSFGFKPAITP